MNFFQRIAAAVSAFFGSKRAHAVEREIAVAASPLVERAVVDMAAANPAIAAVVTTVVIPVAQEELSHLAAPHDQASS